jgi:hypothetical protein
MLEAVAGVLAERASVGRKAAPSTGEGNERICAYGRMCVSMEDRRRSLRVFSCARPLISFAFVPAAFSRTLAEEQVRAAQQALVRATALTEGPPRPSAVVTDRALCSAISAAMLAAEFTHAFAGLLRMRPVTMQARGGGQHGRERGAERAERGQRPK